MGVEVKSSGYSKKCVIPTVIVAVLLAGAAGAGLFFPLYYILFLMTYCPWTQMPTGCYQFFQDSQNWNQAQHLCKQMGVVNLYDLAGHSPACFWIGGYESDPLNNMFS